MGSVTSSCRLKLLPQQDFGDTMDSRFRVAPCSVHVLCDLAVKHIESEIPTRVDRQHLILGYLTLPGTNIEVENPLFEPVCRGKWSSKGP